MVPNQTPAQGQANVPALVQVKAAGELARRKIYAGIPDDDVALALAICQKYGFDPLLKHLVLIATNLKDESTGQWTKRYNAYVTRDGLLHVAHTSGVQPENPGLPGVKMFWVEDGVVQELEARG